MKRFLKWVGMALGGLVILVLGALVYIYIASEQIIGRTYDVPLATLTIPTDSFAVAEGQRLAAIRGCYNGCHGQDLDGEVFFDEPGVGRLVAPNLTQVATSYTDAELERVIRHGVRKDGTSTWAMPSSSFFHLSDADLGAIIAFLRSTPATDGPDTEVHIGPLGRLGVLLGEFRPQAETVDHEDQRLAIPDSSDQAAFGQYLAMTVCTECHGMDLRGSPDGSTPNLVIASAYSVEDFARLMRTGTPLGDRELGLMAEMARRRFIHMTDAEINALYAYLKSLVAPATAASS